MPDPTVDTGAAVQGTLGALGAIGALIGGIVWWFQQRRTRSAAEETEIAQQRAATAAAQAEGGIYARLIERVSALEADVRRLNQELDAERRLRRSVEDHVSLLVGALRQAGITPPPGPVYGAVGG